VKVGLSGSLAKFSPHSYPPQIPPHAGGRRLPPRVRGGPGWGHENLRNLARKPLSQIVLLVALWGVPAMAEERCPVDSTCTDREVTSLVNRTFVLPDLEVTALRYSLWSDSLTIRGRMASPETWPPSRIEPLTRRHWYRRWWVWGVLGSSAVVVAYLWASHSGSEGGRLHVVVGVGP